MTIDNEEIPVKNVKIRNLINMTQCHSHKLHIKR